MRQRLVITDLTQMPDGNKVCVVGIDEQGRTIRPVHDDGFLKNYLYNNSELIIFPRSIVEIDLTEELPDPPHIEDMAFDPGSIKYCAKCDDAKWEFTLLTTSFNTMENIFEGKLRYNSWVAPGALTRSIATLTSSTNHSFAIEMGKSPKTRIQFSDASGNQYGLPVNDLAVRSFCFNKVVKKGISATNVANELNESIAHLSKIYLRIGLARPYKYTDDGKEHCYPQVTGIYTFPDYLKGKTFADFTKRF